MDLRERSASAASRHPWELVRADFFQRLLAEHALLSASTWLDVGAGDAWFATDLRRHLDPDATITCWDINYTPDDVGALEAADGRIELAAVRPTTRFSRILLLDVIEHVEDDETFLGDVVTDLLEPDGRVLISVPAYQSLFTAHDTALGHFRRYTPSQLGAVTAGAGLRVDAAGGLFASLLGARGMTKLKERLSSTRPEWTGIGAWSGGPLATRATVAALSADAALGRMAARHTHRFPGLSCWVLCSRDA